MATLAKFLHVDGLIMKIESTYATDPTPAAATDGALLYFKDRKGIPLKYKYKYDGALGPTRGSLGQQKQIAPSAIGLTGALPMLFRGGGAAYSASVVPSCHLALKAAGYTATSDVTPGSEKWTYAPTVGGSVGGSVTFYAFGRGQKAVGTGGIGNFKIDGSDLSPPIFTLDISAIGTLPVDAACPSITYPTLTVAPPGGGNLAFTFGNMTAANTMIKKWSFDTKRVVTERTALQATGSHLGFVPMDRMPELKVTLEATALATTPYTATTGYDPYQLRDSGQTLSCTMQYGATQYNKIKLVSANAQVVDYDDTIVIDDVPCVELTIRPYNTTPISNDDFTFVAS